MTRYFYDTEFHERGPNHPIDFISIGVVADDDRKFYAVSQEFDFDTAWNNEFLRLHVLPQLPLKTWMPDDTELTRDGGPTRVYQLPSGEYTSGLDLESPLVMGRLEIKRGLEDFILGPGLSEPELWAWYAAYDHVMLSMIFGRMIDLPEGMPMFTHDLKSLVALAGDPVMPPQKFGNHNALDDAIHLEKQFNYAMTIAPIRRLVEAGIENKRFTP